MAKPRLPALKPELLDPALFAAASPDARCHMALALMHDRPASAWALLRDLPARHLFAEPFERSLSARPQSPFHRALSSGLIPFARLCMSKEFKEQGSNPKRFARAQSDQENMELWTRQDFLRDLGALLKAKLPLPRLLRFFSLLEQRHFPKAKAPPRALMASALTCFQSGTLYLGCALIERIEAACVADSSSLGAFLSFNRQALQEVFIPCEKPERLKTPCSMDQLDSLCRETIDQLRSKAHKSDSFFSHEQNNLLDWLEFWRAQIPFFEFPDTEHARAEALRELLRESADRLWNLGFFPSRARYPDFFSRSPWNSKSPQAAHLHAIFSQSGGEDYLAPMAQMASFSAKTLMPSGKNLWETFVESHASFGFKLNPFERLEKSQGQIPAFWSLLGDASLIEWALDQGHKPKPNHTIAHAELSFLARLAAGQGTATTRLVVSGARRGLSFSSPFSSIDPQSLRPQRDRENKEKTQRLNLLEAGIAAQAPVEILERLSRIGFSANSLRALFESASFQALLPKDGADAFIKTCVNHEHILLAGATPEAKPKSAQPNQRLRV